MGPAPGRIDEVLLAVNKPPFSRPGSGTSLLSKSSQLKRQLIPRRGAILFLLPSSAPVIVPEWLDFFVFSAGGTTFRVLRTRPLLWQLHSYGFRTQVIKEPKLGGFRSLFFRAIPWPAIAPSCPGMLVADALGSGGSWGGWRSADSQGGEAWPQSWCL